MPTDIADDARRMAEAYGLVLSVALVIGGAGYGLNRLQRLPLFPPPRVYRSPWSAVDILGLFAFYTLLPSVLALWVLGLITFDAAGTVSGAAAATAAGVVEREQAVFLWAKSLSSVALITVAALIHRFSLGRFPGIAPRRWPADVAVGAATWAALYPLVMIVHFVSLWINHALGGISDEHPIVQINPNSPSQTAYFLAAVCGFVPLAEEFLFRGLLVNWVAELRIRAVMVMAATVALPMAVTLLFTANPRYGPTGFAAYLAVGLVVLPLLRKRIPTRTAMAVYVTAALFATLHSAVWPSPVPLFVLGLGLGWLTARTGGITASTVAHGLFNAVSAIYLLRGGGH